MAIPTLRGVLGSLSSVPAIGLIAQEDFESYVSASNLNGQNGGTYWKTIYNGKNGLYGAIAQEDFESYTSGSSISGLNGGSDWSTAYVH